MFRRRLAPLFSLLLLAGCFATFNGRSAFSRAEKLRRQGDLNGALVEYRIAVASDPKQEAYRIALEEAEREAAAVHVERARQAEAARDFTAAIEAWDRAIEIRPNDEELKARRALAELRTKQADPVVFYRAAKKLAEAIPNDPGAQVTLQEAKKSALGYHLRLAQVYADAQSWQQAHREYEMAKEIEPSHAVFQSAVYQRARARHLEAEGDTLLAKGDALGAYQAYEEAARLSSARGVRQKMKRAKRGAGSVLEQLDQAKRYERQNQWEDAAELYTLIASNASAPVEVKDRARIAREKSATIRSKRAEDYAARGFADKAAAELLLALEHTDGPAKAMDLLSAAFDEIANGAPGSAKPKVEAALTIAPALQVAHAAKVVMATVARVEFDAARAKEQREPAEALVALRRLQPFREVLPGYDAAKQKLVKRAFGALLDRAEKSAAAGRYDAATEELATALEISKPPASLEKPLKEGTAALEKRDYAGARDRFTDAAKADARSKLAKVGQRIATAARLEELHRRAAEARVVEDPVQAASAYRAILEIDPNDESAKSGIEELEVELVNDALATARDHEAAGRFGAAFVYYRRVLDVDPQHPEAKGAMAKIDRALRFGAEPTAYVMPAIRGDHLGDACPGIETSVRDRMVLYLNKTPKLGAAFLDQHETEDVDAKSRQMPPVRLRSAVERCDAKANGQITMTIQLLLGAKLVMQERVTAKFDARSIPKDELEQGVDAETVLEQMIGSAAKEVALKVKQHAGALADWRTLEAKELMHANDAEGVAQIYASLVKDESLSDGERKTVAELERFLMNRFR